ncbi:MULTISPECIES: hypothetical protein [unclassified Pseudanabaena]|uniref:hypothetical protein n=1 Tax=unclassified Pseudanabaena TaxID=2593292 RepID=UPI0006D84C63|nr:MULTISPECIES: hypothetical protein [unclassified Pseudanabaena]TYQ29971.1 hypothetical protein PseudUWO310_11160 [Pseudanabaena sp. UWO310]
MNIGASELIAIIALLGSAFAWINKVHDGFDKRLDKIANDMNGLGSRVSILEGGTCELLAEQINQLKSNFYDIENTVNNLRGD